MSRFKSLLITGLGFLCLSMGGSGLSALLTPDFEILTLDDLQITLQKTHKGCQDFGWNCPEYWACLPIESFSLNCKLTDERERAFAPGIKIRAGGSSLSSIPGGPTQLKTANKSLMNGST